MLEKPWLFLILSFGVAASITIDQDNLLPSSEVANLKTCPFPRPQNIEPCSCKVDEKLQILLICNIDQDMGEELLQRLIKAFACKKEVHLFDIDLNGHSWVTNFSSESLGQFEIAHFHLSNCNSIVGDIQAGAFNGSSYTLKTFHIEPTPNEKSNGVVEKNAFSKLQTLSKVSLGNSFRTIQTKAFFDLPSFQQLTVDGRSISRIETEAFDDLPMLKVLDLVANH